MCPCATSLDIQVEQRLEVRKYALLHPAWRLLPFCIVSTRRQSATRREGVYAGMKTPNDGCADSGEAPTGLAALIRLAQDHMRCTTGCHHLGLNVVNSDSIAPHRWLAGRRDFREPDARVLNHNGRLVDYRYGKMSSLQSYWTKIRFRITKRRSFT